MSSVFIKGRNLDANTDIYKRKILSKLGENPCTRQGGPGAIIRSQASFTNTGTSPNYTLIAEF